MWWPVQWLVIYVLGGLTFVPLVIIGIISYVLTYGSTPIGDSDPDKLKKASLQHEAEKDEQVARARAGSSSRALSGWLTVRRQFKPTSSGVTSIFTSARTTDLSGAKVPSEEKEEDAKPLNGAPTTYSGRIAHTYRQMLEARQAKKDSQPKEFFFCVLKGSVLFLYDDEAQSDCVAAIGVDKYVVSVEPSTGERFKGKDAEMFSKRTGLVMRLAEKVGKEKSGLPVLVKGIDGEDEREMENAPWFLFTISNIKMEDWYIALLQASALKPTTSEVYSVSDMRALVDTIDTEPDPIPMRWLNAMLGRVFFGVYKTEAIEQFIIGKIMRKLSKVPRPSFLGPIVIREVNVGTFPPIFSKPMLKDLNPEGTAAFEVHMQYRSRPLQPNSEVRLTIATTATIPTGFKPYIVDLVLAVVLKSLEGNMMIQIKKPPSNRVWYGFTQMPKMEVEIRPIVSERKIQIGMVLKAIEKQLRDVIAESVVLPNMDDISFFDTSKLGTRGGIFSEAGKVAADQAILEMGVEPIAQPAVIAGEDPASAIAETATLRLRHPSKSMTLDGTALSEIVKEETPEIGLPRTDSAPPTLANGTSAKKGTAVLEIKNWFPGNGRSPSLSSQTVVNGSHNASQESLDKPISRDNEIVKLAAQYAIGPVLPESGSASESSTRPSSPPMKGDSSVNSLGRAPSNSSDSALTERAIPAPDNAAASSSTTALLNNIRARDKKAIQTQVNSARDAVKKWGVNWAAKRRTNIPSKLDERDEDRPAALYRPAEEDEGADQSSTAPLSPTSSQSLKDRLNAAANAPHALPNRVRSTSSASHDSASSSRPSLLPSPSKTTVAPVNHSSSPPKWTLASSRPITEVATDTVLAPNPSRRSSGSAVYVQPSAGRTMVVPRVPKRPGEVTGMGSHPVQGMVRRVSTEDRTELERDQQRPALAPRPSTEEPLPTDHSVSVPPPSHPLDPLRQSPLPTANEPRTDEAIISDDQLAESALSISSTPPPEEALVRSESAPLSISLHSIPIPKDPLPVPIAQNGVSTAAKLASSQDGSTEAILDDDQLAETPQEFTGTAENSGALRLMARRDSKAMISAV